MNSKGFSLVELSIAIAIIGILVGGVILASDLLKGARFVGMVSDIQSYKSAFADFRNKYQSLPGDMPDATDYWISTANGDGDGAAGLIGGGEDAERLLFWEHLSLSGFIDGEYDGTNMPEGPLPGTRFATAYVPTYTTVTTPFWPGAAHQAIMVGQPSAVHLALAGGISPRDAWNTDTKIDDGFPGTGNVKGSYALATCRSTTNASTAEYPISGAAGEDSSACAIYVNIGR